MSEKERCNDDDLEVKYYDYTDYEPLTQPEILHIGQQPDLTWNRAYKIVDF